MTTAAIVSPLVNIHTHQLKSTGAVQVFSLDMHTATRLSAVNFESNSLLSVGFHPLFLNQETVFDEAHLEVLVNSFPIVAIGEIGLDKFSPVSSEFQIRLFQKQAAFARKHRLPVIIHCTGRWNELELLYKERLSSDPPWIIHGFRKTKVAQRFLQLGAYFSLGKALLHDERLQLCVEMLPLERIFLETDDADVDLAELYSKLAAIKSLPLHAVIKQLFTNYNEIFHHDELA